MKSPESETKSVFNCVEQKSAETFEEFGGLLREQLQLSPGSSRWHVQMESSLKNVAFTQEHLIIPFRHRALPNTKGGGEIESKPKFGCQTPQWELVLGKPRLWAPEPVQPE
jgi:hypothetical protein